MATDWVVNVHGKADSGGWEISLLDPEFEHGGVSWGWFGPQKLPVATVSSWMLRDLAAEQIEALFVSGIVAGHHALEKLREPAPGIPS